MKILKIFGIVVGIHVFALVLIFANPGCSSSSKPAPAPVDTVAKTEPAPMITVPSASPSLIGSAPPPMAFNPDAAATPAASPEWERMAGESRAAYQRALDAQRAGDWAKYGEEIKRLGELLERMKQPR